MKGRAVKFFTQLKTGFRRKWSSVPACGRGVLLSFLGLFILFILADILFPLKTGVQYSQLILDKEDKLLHAFLSKDDKWRMYCRTDEISPLLVRTIISKEDRWFRYHPGVNPAAVLRAAWQNGRRGERVSGASTLTMQVVRLLDPKPRTFRNKILEMFRALQLEFHHSKDEILTLYLNLLPYGGNIEGIKAASWLYFGQPPQALSPAQVVTLAIIPNNPKHLRLGIQNERIVKERNIWLQRLFVEGLFSRQELADALAEPLTAQRREAPAFAPHFSLQLQRLYPSETVIRSFIDRKLQDNLENELQAEVQRLRGQGITNAAVVIVNNRTHAVEAYSGSAGFGETWYLGQVDGADALRSPGSALKPFLYALAMDRGLLTPKTMLSDIPLNFNGYRPQNYDQTFRGRVTAGDALALSLNLPAVDLANKMGVDYFIDLLSKGGLQWIEKRKSKLGLSVVLGGCGVTLTELTGLYTSLANQGLHFPLEFRRTGKKAVPDTLFSPEACWLITDILTGLKRPDLPNNFESSIHFPHIAWKTGTSYGRRDAWSFGYNPEYSVGVWVGNFDGTGVPELSGSEFAAPLLFRVFNMLTYNSQPGWFARPKGLDFRLVCPESGLPPGEFCEGRLMDYYIPAVSSNRKCTHLVPVFTDPSGTLSYCRYCLPQAGYRTEYYPNLQPELIAFFEEEHIPFRRIPQHNPGCNRVSRDNDPKITSLADGKEYILYSEASRELQLACAPSADVSIVYWYINNKFLRSAGTSEKIFFKPAAGLTKISCSDDKGRNTDITVKVTFL